MTAVDEGLVRVWVQAGSDFTYEVDAAGGYHIGGPERPLAFEADGAVMIWGPERFDRQAGAGDTPEGRWIEQGSGAEWVFAADGTYEAALDGVSDLGIWALRQGGAVLWAREWRAQLATNGAEVVFDIRNGGSVTYGYTVGGGTWTLFDPVTWAELVRYTDPAALPREA